MCSSLCLVCNCKAITSVEILDRLLKVLDFYNNKLQALQINRSHCSLKLAFFEMFSWNASRLCNGTLRKSLKNTQIPFENRTEKMLITIYGLCVLTGACARSLEGLRCISGPCWACKLHAFQGDQHVPRSQNLLLGGRRPPIKRSKWLISRETISLALIKKHKPVNLMTFLCYKSIAIDRSPINQRTLWFSLFLFCSSIGKHKKSPSNPRERWRKKLQSLSNARQKIYFK